MTIGDWASLFSIVAVVVAIATFIIEGRRNRLTLQVDILLRIDDKFHSSEWKLIRQTAARKLITYEVPNYELEEVLELLSTIAFLYERKAIDTELTYKQFSYWIDRYWLCAENYVEQLSRRNDPLSYKTLEEVARIMVEQELKSGYPEFSQEILGSFLEEESRMKKPTSKIEEGVVEHLNVNVGEKQIPSP